MRAFPVILFLAVSLSPLSPVFLSAEEPEVTLSAVLAGLDRVNMEFRANEAALEAAGSARLAALSVTRPQVRISAPVDGYAIPVGSSELFRDSRFWRLSASNRFSLSQLLPTAGTLTGALSGTLTYGSFDTDTYRTFDSGALSGTVGASVGISQPLFFRGVYDATLSRIEQAYRAEFLSCQRERNRLTLQAVKDYSDYRRARYQAALISARLAGDRETFRRIELEYGMGHVTKAVWYQAQSALLQAEADLLKARQALEAARRILETGYGLSVPAAPDPAPDAGAMNAADYAEAMIEDLVEEPGDREAIVARAIAGNPEIAEIRASMTSLENEMLVARKDNSPTMETSISYLYDNDLTEYELPGHTFSASLSFSSSLADGGAYRNQQAQRGSRLSQLESRLAAQERTVTNRVHSLMDSLEQGVRLAEIYALQEEAARFDLDRGVKDFELGQITRKELLERQQELELIRMNIQSNRIDRNMAFLELCSLAGIDIFESLVEKTSDR